MAQGLPDRALMAGVAIHPAAGQALRFGPFGFDRANRVLIRDGVELPLPPRALGVLEYLLERPGSIVSKSALMEAVWPDTAVTETSLTEAVSLVRQALGDDPQQPAYVQTVHRRGYRFLGPVEVEGPSGRGVPLPIAEREAAPGDRRRLRAALLWVLVAGAMAIAGWSLWRSPARTVPSPTRFTIALPAGDPAPAKAPASLALSPDGRLLAYTAGRGEKSQLFIRPLDRFEASGVAGTAGAAAPFFSPDGRWVGFFADGRLKKTSVGGGTPLEICEAAYPLGASWGDNDVIVFAPTYRGGLMRVAASGGAAERLTQPDVAAGEIAHLWPEVLPGAEAVVFTIWTSSGRNTRLAAASLRTGERLALSEPGSFARYLPSGHLVYGRADGIVAAAFDPRRTRLTGPPRAVLSGVATSVQVAIPHFALSREGTLAYVPGDGKVPLSSLGWLRPGGATVSLPTAERPFMNADLSPDGRRVAVTINEGTRSDVWVADGERGVLSRLTFEGHNVEPVFSPDGHHVTYAAGGSGPLNLFWVPADGSGGPSRLLKSPFNQYPNSWARDGSLLVFTELHPDTGADLWALARGEARPRPLLRTRFDEDLGLLSSDGRWLAYESNESNRWEVYVRPFPAMSPRWQVSTEGGYAALWSPDGRTIYYHTEDDTLLAIDMAPGTAFQPSRARVVARDAHAAWYGVNADGRLLSIRKPGGGPPAPIHVVVGWSAELNPPPGAP